MPMKVAQRIDVSKFMSYIKVRQLSHMKGSNNDLLLLSFGHRASLRKSHLDMHSLLQFSGFQLAGTNQVLFVCICSPCPHSFKLLLLCFFEMWYAELEEERNFVFSSCFQLHTLLVVSPCLTMCSADGVCTPLSHLQILFFSIDPILFFQPVTFLLSCYLS